MNRRAVALALFALLTASAAPAAELASKKALTLETARIIADAAQQFAAKNGWNVIMAILDDGGNLLYFQRMDGAQIGSIDVALRKAEAAIKFRRETKAFSDGVAERVQLLALPGSIAFEGGVPITVDGEIIGSVGVSGATAEQDGLIAKAGIEALLAALK
jgi:uncharacterized protein GlcG (DUF336 family)